MNRKHFAVLIAVALAASGCCSMARFGTTTVQGSGSVASEARRLGRFTSIVIQNSADVDIALGDTGSVTIEAEDNLLPYIQTRVWLGRLTIRTRPLASISATRPIHIIVTTRTLGSVSLQGSGNVRAADLNGKALQVRLPGSGTIAATGTVDQLRISLDGSGDIACSTLQARATTVNLTGSGNVSVYASERLDATLSGSGNIRYAGNPATVRPRISGSGHITPQ
jgi:hypothetical protein